jgi:hypothetical protein
LLTSQPALRRLKDGLVDAQLATARLAGTRSADHPRVKAAIESEKEIRADLHRELQTAVRGAEAEVRLGEQRLEATRTRLGDVQGRLDRLAERRAEYSNRVAAVDNSRITLDRARQNLSTARAAEAAARSGSLVTRIDKPETGPYPAGPGRTVVTAAGGLGGLMLGLGLVFLTTGPPPSNSSTTVGAGEAKREAGAARDNRLERGVEPIDSPAEPMRSLTPLVARRTAPPEPVEELWPVAGESRSLEPAARVAVPEPVVSEAPTASPVTKTVTASTPELLTTPVPNDMGSIGERFETAKEVVTPSPPMSAPAPTEPTRRASVPVKVEDPAVLKPAAQESTPQPTLVDEAPIKKPILPTAAGKLPRAAGTLPPLAGVPIVGGLSLQEALQAAREVQR